MLKFLSECFFRAVGNGTSDFVVAGAITGYYTPAQCTDPAVVDGATYEYRAESDDLLQRETGEGVYSTATNTLTRAKVHQSTNAGSKVSFTSPPRVRVEILPTALANRPINLVDDCGAIGDGNIANAATNAAALTAALATGRDVFIPYTSAGYHFGANTITVGTGQRIRGESHVKLFSTVSGSNCFLRMTGYNTVSGVHGVHIDMTGAGASSTAIRFGTSSGVVWRVELSDLRFSNCVEAIGDEVHATNYVVETQVRNVNCWLTLGRQVYIRRSRGFCLWRDILIDRTQDSPAGTWGAAKYDDMAGLELDRFDVVGPVTTTHTNDWALDIVGNLSGGYQAVWLRRVFVDTAPMHGIRCYNLQYLWANEVEGNFCSGHQVYFYNCSKAFVTDSFAGGAKGRTGAAVGAAGITFDTCTNVSGTGLRAENCTGSGLVFTGCSDMQVNNLRSDGNTADGVYINNTTNFMATGVIARTNTGYGIEEAGTSDNNIVVNASLSSNTAGNLSVVGANSRIAVPVREVLSANRTYYVRTDGSNSNTGRANTSGGAFLTIQKALDVVATLDFNGFTVTIQIGDGTYTAGGSIPAVVGQAGVSNLIIQGNSATPGNVVVSTTSASCFTMAAFGKARIKDMELRTTTGGYCLTAMNQGVLEWGNIRFGACAQSHVIAQSGGQAFCISNYAITGAAARHIQADGAGSQAEVGGFTVTISGTPAFSSGFAFANTNGVLRLFSNTYSGSATGVRYTATNGGGINTFGAGATALPGDTAGSATSPGWYA